MKYIMDFFHHFFSFQLGSFLPEKKTIPHLSDLFWPQYNKHFLAPKRKETNLAPKTHYPQEKVFSNLPMLEKMKFQKKILPNGGLMVIIMV